MRLAGSRAGPVATNRPEGGALNSDRTVSKKSQQVWNTQAKAVSNQQRPELPRLICNGKACINYYLKRNAAMLAREFSILDKRGIRPFVSDLPKIFNLTRLL